MFFILDEINFFKGGQMKYREKSEIRKILDLRSGLIMP